MSASASSVCSLALVQCERSAEGQVQARRLTDASAVDAAALIRACESVWRQYVTDTPQDSEAYAALLSDLLLTQPLTLLVALRTDSQDIQVVGLLVYRVYPNTFNYPLKLQIELIVVDESLRSRGIGSALVAETKAVAIRLGAPLVVCDVDSLNHRAVHFFSAQHLIILCYYFAGSAAAQGPSQIAADHPVSPSVSASPSPPPPASSPRTLQFDVLPIVRADGIVDERLLRAAERVHRQLRPDAFKNVGYVERMKVIYAAGARQVVAVLRPEASASPEDEPVVLGVCMYRFFRDASRGGALRNYVDDLVSDETRRSMGVGHAMLEAVREECRALGVKEIELDSGVQRHRAHRFYFRDGFFITKYFYGIRL